MVIVNHRVFLPFFTPTLVPTLRSLLRPISIRASETPIFLPATVPIEGGHI